MKKILNGPTVWRAKCPVCDCEFEYDACEIRSEFLESPTDYEIIRVVECPSCKFKISHKENPKSPTEERGYYVHINKINFRLWKMTH